MKARPLFALIFLLTGLTFSASALAQSKGLTPARPLDFDREIQHIADDLHMMKLEVGEQADFSANGVKRVTVDETRFVDVRTINDNKRLALTGRQIGKAVVRAYMKDGTFQTFIVTVTATCKDD